MFDTAVVGALGFLIVAVMIRLSRNKKGQDYGPP